MASPHAERFMNALQQAERTGDLVGLDRLFTEDAELSYATDPEPHRGRHGAHEFWREYLESFECVCSRFTGINEVPGAVVLQWASEGVRHGGAEFSSRGATVLEIDPSGSIRRLRTYYDPAPPRPLTVTQA